MQKIDCQACGYVLIKVETHSFRSFKKVHRVHSVMKQDTWDRITSSNKASMTSVVRQVLQENSEPYWTVKRYLNLHRAARNGDWRSIQGFFLNDPNAMTADISGYQETVLHVAVWMGHADLIQKLLQILPPEALEKQSYSGETALHIAAMGGRLEIVRALVEKNPGLTQIKRKDESTPLLLAAYFPHEQVVRYLCAKTSDAAPCSPFTGPSSGALIVALIHSGLYDVALTLLKRYPRLGYVKAPSGANLLSTLALKPSDFLSGSSMRFWELWIYHYLVPAEINNDVAHVIPMWDEEDPHHQISDDAGARSLQLRTCMGKVLIWINKMTWNAMKLVPRIQKIEQEKLKHKYIDELMHLACEAISNLEEIAINTVIKQVDRGLNAATENGIVEIVTICFQYFPSLYWIKFLGGRSIIHVATRQRREKIFNLLYEKTALNNVVSSISDEHGDTLLHAVAKLAPIPQLRSIPCPAIQMQREIQWFEAVENLIQPHQRTLRNKNMQTPDQLFTNEHSELVKEAERWMKDTSNSCMLVSTLIATVVFAAAFDVPGGIDQGKGTPIFLKETTLMVFAISDALALFFACTSILMFLSILTARYTEYDFLKALPTRLIIGLASLFIAIVAMMVAFGSALQIMLSERWKWVYIPTMVLGFLLVALFMRLQVPLFLQMVWSTYGPSIFRPQTIL